MSVISDLKSALLGSDRPEARAIEIVAVFALAILANALMQRAILRELTHGHLKLVPARLQKQAGRITRLVLFGVAFIVALSITRLPLGDLFTSLGVVAILTAFLANQLLVNIIAGLVLVVDRPFGLGDALELGGLPATAKGPYEVLSIGMRTTRLRAAGGETVIVPNVWFLTNPFVNRRPSGDAPSARAE